MSTVSVISYFKVAPSPNPLKNNFVSNELNIINKSKFLIITEAFLGINRLYLFQYNKLILQISVLYSLLVLCGAIALTFELRLESASTLAIKYTKHVEIILFILYVLFYNKNRYKTLFKNLNAFDEMLNIQNNLSITSSAKYVIVWTLACFLLNMIDIILYMTSLTERSVVYNASFFVINLAHDLEQVFIFTLLRSIYFRLLILKAHVVKVFNSNESKTLGKVERLSEKVRFDVSSLHRVYELLHKCSEQLNSIMNFPILIIFFSTSLITIMMLKKLITIVQDSDSITHSNLAIIFIVYRCLKYTIFVVIPCYYSSITAGQTTTIRTILHDAVNNMPMSKTERRKVKTFFHLTRESDFAYTICGVIRLDMSLPLSYMSLCTTYLVIIIQFSKFID